MPTGGIPSWCFLLCTRAVVNRSYSVQYVEWTKAKQETQMVPLDGKPARFRTFTADAEKQQAVVEAFRVSSLSGPPLQNSVCDRF